MKNLLTLFITVLSVFLGTSNAFSQSSTLEGMKVFPRPNSIYKDSLFWFKMEPKTPEQISYIDLYVNNKPAGKDTRPPFQWGKGTDLRRGPKVLQPGTQKIKAIIRTKDGKRVTKYYSYRLKK